MFKKLKHNKNYKLIIGLAVGFFVSSTIVSALYLGTASELSYDLSNTWLTSTTVQGALDELYEQKDCPLGYTCFPKKNALDPGDYISYTPSSSSYTTDTAYTGYTSTQTINPSELILWRVLSLNQDGTVDIISEDVSSTAIYFKGQTGYQNFVGYLNVLASQYENSAYTIGSRHFGYDSQTETITDTTYFTNPAPWVCSTNGSSGNCSLDPDDYEAYGGGDNGYLTDYDLAYNVLGTRLAYKAGTSNFVPYWMASRLYYYSSATRYSWHGRLLNTNAYGNNTNLSLYSYDNSKFTANAYGYAIRPIVTLKSTLSYSGVGTKDYPMEIQ